MALQMTRSMCELWFPMQTEILRSESSLQASAVAVSSTDAAVSLVGVALRTRCDDMVTAKSSSSSMAPSSTARHSIVGLAATLPMGLPSTNGCATPLPGRLMLLETSARAIAVLSSTETDCAAAACEMSRALMRDVWFAAPCVCCFPTTMTLFTALARKASCTSRVYALGASTPPSSHGGSVELLWIERDLTVTMWFISAWSLWASPSTVTAGPLPVEALGSLKRCTSSAATRRSPRALSSASAAFTSSSAASRAASDGSDGRAARDARSQSGGACRMPASPPSAGTFTTVVTAAGFGVSFAFTASFPSSTVVASVSLVAVPSRAATWAQMGEPLRWRGWRRMARCVGASALPLCGSPTKS